MPLAKYLFTFPGSQALPVDPLLEALPPQKAPIVWRQRLQAFNSRQSLGLRKKGKDYKIIRQQRLLKGVWGDPLSEGAIAILTGVEHIS